LALFNEFDLDDIFTYHKWNAEQIKLGGDVRRAGKELARAILRTERNASNLSWKARDTALSFVRLAVQEANAAITFEAGFVGYGAADAQAKQKAEDLENTRKGEG
jgi:hypothetical protein